MEKYLPLVTVHQQDDIDAMLDALERAGYHSAEIAFRTEFAQKAIEKGIKSHPDMFIGAGTVLNRQQAELAFALGSKFLVSPGFSKAVAEVSKAHNIPYYPGVSTATEVMMALEEGITEMKFFPAEAMGGVKVLKALKGPFPQVKFLPTGGINRNNMEDYLALDNVFAVGGSFFLEEALKK